MAYILSLTTVFNLKQFQVETTVEFSYTLTKMNDMRYLLFLISDKNNSQQLIILIHLLQIIFFFFFFSFHILHFCF